MRTVRSKWRQRVLVIDVVEAQRLAQIQRKGQELAAALAVLHREVDLGECAVGQEDGEHVAVRADDGRILTAVEQQPHAGVLSGRQFLTGEKTHRIALSEIEQVDGLPGAKLERRGRAIRLAELEAEQADLYLVDLRVSRRIGGEIRAEPAVAARQQHRNRGGRAARMAPAVPRRRELSTPHPDADSVAQRDSKLIC